MIKDVNYKKTDQVYISKYYNKNRNNIMLFYLSPNFFLQILNECPSQQEF